MSTHYVFLSSQFFCCNHHVLFFLIPSCYLLCFSFLSLKNLFIKLFSSSSLFLVLCCYSPYSSLSFLVFICYFPCSFLLGLELLLTVRFSFLGLKLLFIIFLYSSLFLVLYFAHHVFLLLFSLHGPLMLLTMFFFSNCLNLRFVMFSPCEVF